MSMEIGIIGLPNVGKSTLFNALTRAGAAVASYPFTTIEPNVGVVPVDDARLHEIALLVGPEEVIPTTVRFVDIAGLVAGASQGEGLGNQFLGHVRDVDAVAVVVRCFGGGRVPHVSGTVDPVADVGVLDTELLLADLAVIERRIEKVRGGMRVQPRAHADEMEWLAAVRDHVAGGRPARSFDRTPHDPAHAEALNLITARPRMFVLNVAESDLPDGGPLAAAAARLAEAEGAPAVVVCAELESALAEWPRDEAAAYRADLGVEAGSLARIVAAGYRLLDLITFFTTTGGRIVQAWTVSRGAHAVEAAGRVHSDIARGFIRAEVVGYDDLVSLGGMHAVREHGHLRLEGRDYPVRDGDVIHFRFHV